MSASVAEWLQYLREHQKNRGSNAASVICLEEVSYRMTWHDMAYLH